MKCPNCPDATLVMSERMGIEIDYCPTCRGVWLDRGELDKVIERASAMATGPGSVLASPTPAPVPLAPTVSPPVSPGQPPQPPYSTAPQPAAPYPAPPPQDQRYWTDDDSSGDLRRKGPGYHRKRKSFLGDLFDF